MKIIIIGAGLGGLSAAICFARKGHEVQVLEQHSHVSRAGTGLNIRSSASRIMHAWGLREDLERISDDTPANCFRSLQTGAVATRTVAADIAEHPDWGTHREDLIALLERRARDASARLVFDAGVVEVRDEDDEDGKRVVVVQRNGTEATADLVLAADGIRSRTRSQILADLSVPIDPLLSDITLYGIVLKDDQMRGIPELEPLMENAYINVYMGHQAFVVSRHNGKLHRQSCLFGIKGETDQKGLWDERGDIEHVRKFFAGSCPELRKILELAQSCDRWRLAEMPNLPRWTSRNGRIVLLGDSAHAMQPNAAHGFSQIVEDIGVLEYLISQDDSAVVNMANITSDWESIRRPRVERIKAWAKANSEAFIGQPPTGTKHADKWQIKSLKHTKPDMHANMNSSAFLKWAQDYDAIHEAHNSFEGYYQEIPVKSKKPARSHSNVVLCAPNDGIRTTKTPETLHWRQEREMMHKPPSLMYRPDSRLNDPKLKPLLLVDRIQPPDQANQYQSSPKSIRYPSPKASSFTSNGPEPHRYPKRSISQSLHAQYALTMDRYIWNGYRRQPNRGTVSLFRLLRPSILSLARRMYGGDGVADVVFGRHKDTAYVLIRLAREPEGAEGHASDEFMALSANFYEVLKDGQAGEADVIAGHDSLKSLKGASLVDLYEIQVQHPISGRLLVGPIEKQKRFMGL